MATTQIDSGVAPHGKPEEPKRSWLRRHKVLAGTIAVAGIAIASTAVGGGGTAAPNTDSVVAQDTTTSDNSATQPVEPVSAEPEQPAAAAAAPTWDDGTYLVGIDIPAGDYRGAVTSVLDAGCWARLSATDGSLEAIIANANPTGPFVVTIDPTDKAIELTGVELTPLAAAAPLSIGGTISDGVYLVGTDIRAGEYRGTVTSDVGTGYWARLNATNGALQSIITNDNPTGPFVVTIDPTDKAIELSGVELKPVQ